MKQIYNILIQFILGGGIIVGMNYLTKYFGAKYAALLYAVPLMFTIASVLIYRDYSKAVVQQLCISSVYSTIILCLFLGAFYLLLKKLDFGMSLFISYILFFSIGIIFLRYFK